MELQWPLILFTTFVAWCAGLFGAQALAALRGEAKNSQMISWIVAAVLLVIGGISVFLHLEHWERIFNGFGHITSGITQELICIVLLAIVAVVYLVMLRKSGEGSVPAWCAIAAIIVSAALVSSWRIHTSWRLVLHGIACCRLVVCLEHRLSLDHSLLVLLCPYVVMTQYP